jgi:hypothetical protein
MAATGGKQMGGGKQVRCRVQRVAAASPDNTLCTFARQLGGGGQKTCFKCGKPGHWSRDCTVRRVRARGGVVPAAG